MKKLFKNWTKKKITMLSLVVILGTAGIVSAIVIPVLTTRKTKNKKVIVWKGGTGEPSQYRFNKIIWAIYEKFPTGKGLSHENPLELSYDVLKSYNFSKIQARKYVIDLVYETMHDLVTKTIKDKREIEYFLSVFTDENCHYFFLPKENEIVEIMFAKLFRDKTTGGANVCLTCSKKGGD